MLHRGIEQRGEQTVGNLEKFPPWNFSRRKVKCDFHFGLHFQSLIVIEKDGVSLPRSGILIFRDAR